MPLIKLWNTIRGKSADSAGVANPKQATKKKLNSGTASRDPQVPVPSKPAAKPKLSLLDRFGGGPHAATCRLVRSSGATSILEIGVGDGERALAMTAALVEANGGNPVRYVAIDMFEMADGPITLKDFHKQIRAQNVQPTLVPMSVSAGLNRVSSTVGVVDLILIADPVAGPAESVALLDISKALKKVASENTSIYQLTDEQWVQIDLDAVTDKATRPARRAA
ncbi:hypothetical protein [Planctomycetes bacterium K23_9]|uniref:Uncharacterized protein n=1 Tax=Stieleria marina TaxID=1930275 RepID=A0A517P300_9BACT|nr:hypothetical protein K239x_57740 [Planctomycetes bacterium K23_9]